MEPNETMAGIRVVELTTFGFVPSGVALLADWGADVVKIEHTGIADPMRGLMAAPGPGGVMVDTLMDHLNRGKRNLTLDLGSAEGREVLYELVRRSDAFVTSFMKPAQRKLGVTYDDLRAINPTLVYAHGHGYGPRGPDAEEPGFDGISYWARGGVGHALTFDGGPPAQQRAAFGDVMGGLSVAAGVAAALLRRAMTGEGGPVDVSLLGVACWQLAPDIIGAAVTGGFEQRPLPAPGTGPYQTADGRYVVVLLLLPHYLPNVLAALDREELLADQRIAAHGGGVGVPPEVDTALREAIGALTSTEIRQRFSGQDIAWSIMQSPDEVLVDPQVVANDYVLPAPTPNGPPIIAGPVQFAQQAPSIRSGAPRQGEHSIEILRELDFDNQTIAGLVERGVTTQPSTWDDHGKAHR